MKLVKPKPDISLAKKTGHFNLLTTGKRQSHSCIFRHESAVWLPSPAGSLQRAARSILESTGEDLDSARSILKATSEDLDSAASILEATSEVLEPLDHFQYTPVPETGSGQPHLDPHRS